MKFKNLLRGCVCVSMLTGLTFSQSDQLYAQVQLGMDIDGESPFDLSGRSVSLSSNGTRVAIGADQNAASGAMNPGYVQVFELMNNTDWVQMGANIEGEAAGDGSGFSVSLSADGERVAIGAFRNDGNGGLDVGHVRVFDYNGTDWVQAGLDIDGENTGDQFGRSISLSSDGMRLAIGGPGNDAAGSAAGYVQAYFFIGNGWLKLGQDINGEAAGDGSGGSVSLSGDGTRLAIGASGNDGTANRAGHVRVYELNPNTFNWEQMGTDIDGEAERDLSGGSVSLSSDGTRLAIGASDNDGGANNAGHVRAFEFVGADWVQMGTDIDDDLQNVGFGGSVSISDDGTRLAGAGTAAVITGGIGRAKVFEFNASDWVQVNMDIEAEAANDLFGSSISLSSDGMRLAVGATANEGESGDNPGSVRVYNVDDNVGIASLLSGTPGGKLLIYPNPHTGNQLSWSIPDLPTSYQSALVSIHDAYGKLVMSKNIMSENNLELDESLASGIYFVTLSTGERSYMEKLVVR